jgi:hypothetical protein
MLFGKFLSDAFSSLSKFRFLLKIFAECPEMKKSSKKSSIIDKAGKYFECVDCILSKNFIRIDGILCTQQIFKDQ